ncbi:uncharacterized protein LOC126733917 [Anthonomus grandis grandis]|uniref:uncharacterized protein LOC126733917 n=1 Tax=Anthonomus grandis grandis TaxID=2921223 RepID=UPI002166B882|nr:uncharacterized protein LOC126733917 [Anthonomus grandis grandis]XP_050293341.1 uncharacterized protein LOC126733917 [Anthonomus grandis grandis]
MEKSSIIFTLTIILQLLCYLVLGNEEHHRQKRYLLFPFQGTFKTVYSFAIPWKLGPKQEMGVGWNFQFQYPLPYNTTSISSYPSIISRKNRDKRDSELPDDNVSDRAIFYQGVENLLDRQDLNGKECVLKAICENTAYTHFADEGSLLGQILHVFLTPDNGDGPHPALDPSYADAQKSGEYGADCATAYPNCKMNWNFFDMFSIYGK